MTVTQKGILTLLKSAVTQQPLELPKDFNMEQALPVIRRHSIQTLAFDGALLCGIPRQDPVMQQLFKVYCRSVVVSEGQQSEVDRICKAFDREAIDYMLLKGIRMKKRYPKPELRPMGDADILIRMEQYEKIVPIMVSLGFTAKDETDHEYVWQSDMLFLELHKRLIPSYNKDFYAYFGDGWDLARYRQGTSYSMTAEDEMIYQFTHFAKHYRDGGIGLRHVSDLWVCRTANPDLNMDYIQSELQKLQLLAFYENICRLIDVWFGEEAPDSKTEFMTEFIFASGSFGQIETRVLSRAVRDSKQSVLGFSGRLVYFWKTLFPGVDILRGKYTVLKKCPWLLPLVWLVRPFYKLLFERDTIHQQKKNFEVLTRENLDMRHQMMQYVGLDYHF